MKSAEDIAQIGGMKGSVCVAGSVFVKVINPAVMAFRIITADLRHKRRVHVIVCKADHTRNIDGISDQLIHRFFNHQTVNDRHCVIKRVASFFLHGLGSRQQCFDIEGSDGTGLRFGSRDYYMALLPGKEDQLNAFGLVRGGVCNVEVIDFNPSGREVKVAGDYSVPYELLEIATYMAEFAKAQRVDFEKPVALDWLYDLNLSEDFEIMFWQ